MSDKMYRIRLVIDELDVESQTRTAQFEFEGGQSLFDCDSRETVESFAEMLSNVAATVDESNLLENIRSEAYDEAEERYAQELRDEEEDDESGWLPTPAGFVEDFERADRARVAREAETDGLGFAPAVNAPPDPGLERL